MKTAYQIIRRPVITEKGLVIKDSQNTLVFQVAPQATKTEIKEVVQSIFKVKVHSIRTAVYPGTRADGCRHGPHDAAGSFGDAHEAAE